MYFCSMKTTKRRMPAEWEPQSQVQLTWPHAATDWAPMLPDITAVYCEMAREILKREALLIVAPEGAAQSISRSLLAGQGAAQPVFNYQLSIIDSNDTWARDHGFITVEEPSSPTHHPSSITYQTSDLRPQTSSSSTSASTAGARSSRLNSTTASVASSTTAASSRDATKTIWTSCSKAAPSRATAEAPSSPPPAACWPPTATNR